MSSTLAFSLLFLVPAALAVLVWIVLRTLDRTIGLGSIAFYPWLLLLPAPAIASALIAQWACRRSGTGSATTFGFSVGAAMLAVLFTVVASAWVVNAGD